MREFITRHWVGLLAIVGGAAATWFQLNYVLDKVNPDTVLAFQAEQVLAFQVEQARLAERRDIRWCSGKAALRDQTAVQALECAD